jgi:hypothetical protein
MSDKNNLYNSLPKNGIVAEIGVFNGDGSRSIFKRCDPKELWLIDTWSPGDDESTESAMEHYLNVMSWASSYSTNGKKIRIIRDQSIAAASYFADEYFDWVYIDADHRYQPVKDDLHVWTSKVKKDGFICGDDFTMYDPSWEGVHKAVIEYVLKYMEDKPELLEKLKPLNENWDISYKTPDWLLSILKKNIEHFPSFWERAFKIKKSDLKKYPSNKKLPSFYKNMVAPLPPRLKKRLDFMRDVLDLSDILVYDASDIKGE